MVRSEISKILTVIAASYSNMKFEIDDYKINLWFKMLGDIEYRIANLAIEKLIMTNKFPPSIAEIRATTAEITRGENITAGEAWGEVEKALHDYGSCRYDANRLEMAMNSLSETTRKVVKYLNWTEICDSENLGVIRGQFMKMYDIEAKREAEKKLLPPQLLNQIQMISNRTVTDLKVIEGGK